MGGRRLCLPPQGWGGRGWPPHAPAIPAFALGLCAGSRPESTWSGRHSQLSSKELARASHTQLLMEHDDHGLKQNASQVQWLRTAPSIVRSRRRTRRILCALGFRARRRRRPLRARGGPEAQTRRCSKRRAARHSAGQHGERLARLSLERAPCASKGSWQHGHPSLTRDCYLIGGIVRRVCRGYSAGCRVTRWMDGTRAITRV